MTTESVVWAMMVRTDHTINNHNLPMNLCSKRCQLAEEIMEKDQAAKS